MRKAAIFILLAFLASAVTLQDVLNKNYEAKGGLEKLKSIKTLYSEGRVVAQGMEMPFKAWVKFPDKIRMETEFQGQKMVQAYDGKNAWWIVPMLGINEPQLMPPEQAKQFKEQMQFKDPLVYYKELGHKLEYLGEEEMEGTPVYKIKMIKKNGDIVIFYIDKDSGLEIKLDFVSKREGMEMQGETIFGNYQKVDGVLFPFYIETRMGGNVVSQVTITKIVLNQPMDDTIFQMKK